MLLAQSFTPNPDWRFENFNSQNHFISRGIADIALDKHGYVWSCSGGVQRFDGYKTTDYNSFDQANSGLRGNYTSLKADNTGKIWVCSLGICNYDDASGKFIYIKTDPKHHIASVNSYCLQKNNLWFACDYGLAKLDLKTLKISYTALKNVTDPLCSYLLDDNTVLLSSREKFYIYNIATDTYKTNTLIYNHTLIKTFSIIKTGNQIFLGTSDGLFSYNNLTDLEPVSNGVKDAAINDLVFLPQDKEEKYLFMATEGKGIVVYNTALKKVEFTYMHYDSNPYSVPSNIITKFYVDKTCRLWLSTSIGISMLDVVNQQLKMRFLNKSNSDELGINKIAKDKYDSTKVWMSSYNQGLICVNWETKKIERAFDANPAIKRINDFVQLSKSRFLLATKKAIVEWDVNNGIQSQQKLPVPDSIALVCNIRKIITAGDNVCFITTDKGLFKYELGSRHFKLVTANNLTDKSYTRLKFILLNGFYDKGIVWAASRDGLFSYNTTTNKTVNYRGKGEKPDYFFFDIAPVPGNQIVCAAGSGINIFNTETKQFTIVNSLAGLHRPGCENVICINNMIWAGTEAGILNYDLKTHTSSRAEHETSMMQIYPSSSFAVLGKDIIFGFGNGYAYFTQDLKNNLAPSDPVIEKIDVNNQPVFLPYPSQKDAGSLTFTHSNNSVNIAFTSFLYSDPDHINFRYRLSGAGNRWQYANEQRNANYTQLPPGDYTFFVQCGNKNGVWNNHLASFSFIITPPYWETWWFRVLVILVIAFGLYQLYRYKIKHILAIERIRERIASDFHDDIGSALSSISIFSDVADKQLQQKLPPEQTREVIGHISHHSQTMLEAMDDIIWAVNPQNDHFNDLAVRMREFAIPLLEASNINFYIDIQEDILSARVKMEARKNIFMIFKECINNILKHAECTAIKITVTRLNNHLELTISDNGKGFDINAKSNRNGLKNIKKRAAEIDGVIEVISEPDKGTVTRLVVNII
ncbi:sensor histidine kinase [Mucilaginibacter flavidus]|uniref:sensor histidine kinase n=1 Tax=Mucilaginibacter flavidus TaxID=2949309 RepID=UPI002093BA9D|nr:triple tyrosine motif-containing protein [Mucilaginibacter flavidus]